MYERDGGQCRFVDEMGRRCPARARLEYHHLHPFGLGGDHRPENIHLVCTRFATWDQELSDIDSRIKNELLGEMKDLSFGWLTQIDKITGDPIHCKQLFSHASKVLKLVVDEHVAKGHAEMPSMPRRAKIIVEKNRGGPEGIAHTWFHKRFTRFYDSEFLLPERSQ